MYLLFYMQEQQQLEVSVLFNFAFLLFIGFQCIIGIVELGRFQTAVSYCHWIGEGGYTRLNEEENRGLRG